MNKVLLLFAKGFPYNISEPFLENEYPLYSDYFDQIIIVTGCKRGEQPSRRISDPAINVLSDFTLSKDKKAIIEALPYVLTDSMFYQELWKLIKGKQLSPRRMYQLCVMSLCGNHRALMAKRWIQSRNLASDVEVAYSYWLDIPAYAAIRFRQLIGKTGIRVVSRCHGYDVYSERKPGNYMPFQEQILRQVNSIASVSKAGMDYLQEKYALHDRIFTWYLGSADKGVTNPYSSRETFRIVSCARVVPLKRLTRIVDGLRLLRGQKIMWTHIGGGEGLEELKEYATRNLPEEVQVEWRGTIPNEEVYAIYGSEPFHAFISVSSTEGLPVSMCEAFSFQIPIIATAVGGVPEIVEDGICGKLLLPDFSDEEFVTAIEWMAGLPETDYLKMREAARAKFESTFDAQKNNREFIESYLT